MSTTKRRRDKRSNSEKLIQTALESWHDPEKLGKHPLASFRVVENRRGAASYGDTAYDLGKALRDLLEEALDDLKPEGREPELDPDTNPAPEWHHYLILKYRYITKKRDRKTLGFLAHCLNISVKTCGRLLNEGLSILLDQLEQQEKEAKAIQAARDRWVDLWIPPKPTHNIVGQEKLLADIKDKLTKAGRNVSIALCGGPGIGKTALAMELVHNAEVRNYFRDGILWASLVHKLNSTNEEEEADILLHLHNWGEVVRISIKNTKDGDEEQSRKIEDLKRILKQNIGSEFRLIIIDNVWNKQSIRNLKIDGANCSYLKTTRNSKIAEWFALDNSIFVQELNKENSEKLVSQLAPEAYSSHTKEVQNLVQEVRGLPLLLVLMGGYLKVESMTGQRRHLEDAFRRLRNPKYRLLLSELEASIDRPPGFPEDVPVSLAAWIKFSEEVLDDQSRQALQALSLFPPKPNTFSEEAARGVSKIPVSAIDRLVMQGLLESSGPGRYTMHSTISDYARWLLMDRGLHTKMVHSYVRYYLQSRFSLAIFGSKVTFNSLELKNILAALKLAYNHEMRPELIQGANDLYWYFDVSGLHSMAKIQLKRALRFARSLGDLELIAMTLHNLGRAAIQLGDLKFAKHCFELGLVSACAPGNPVVRNVLLSGPNLRSRHNTAYLLSNEVFTNAFVLGTSLYRGVRDISANRLRNLRNETATVGLQYGINLEFRQMSARTLAEIGRYDMPSISYIEHGGTITRPIMNRGLIMSLLSSLNEIQEKFGDSERSYISSADARGGVIKAPPANSLMINAAIDKLHKFSPLDALDANEVTYVEAKLFYQEALMSAEGLGDLNNIPNILVHLAGVEISRKNYASAKLLLMEALKLTEVLSQKGEEKEPLRRSLDGKEIWERAKRRDLPKVGFMLKTLSVLSIILGDFEETNNYLQDALKESRKSNNLKNESDILIRLGALHIATKKSEMAISVLDEALGMARRTESQDLIAKALFRLAQAENLRGNREKAIQLARESLEFFESLKHKLAFEVRQFLKDELDTK